MDGCQQCYALYRNPMDERQSGHLRPVVCEGRIYTGIEANGEGTERYRSRVIQHYCGACSTTWLRFESPDGALQEWKLVPQVVQREVATVT